MAIGGLHMLLERRGHVANLKRVYRLYLEEGRSVRRRKRPGHLGTRQNSASGKQSRRTLLSQYGPLVP
jgi:hypothetical protein